VNDLPVTEATSLAKRPPRRLVTRRRAAVAFLVVAAVLLGFELRQQLNEARAIESLIRQGFSVERSAPEDAIRGWLRKTLLQPIHQESLLEGPVGTVTDKFYNVPARPDNLSPLTAFPSLEEFSLQFDRREGREQRINDTLLAPLVSLKCLKKVDLHGPSSVTDRFLASLSNCPELERLSVASSKVTDEGLRHLGACKNLKLLTLMGCPIRRGLKYLDLDNLASLDARDTELDDEGIACLVNARNLGSLLLNGTDIGNRSFEVFSSLPKLEHLQCRGTKITDEGLATFQPHPMLNHLNLSETSVTIDAAARLTTRFPTVGVVLTSEDNIFVVEKGHARALAIEPKRQTTSSGSEHK
jgi:hypothetical protein